jgi:hypothetical protein
MSIMLDLPQSLEKELSAEAAQLGLSLSEYVTRILIAGRRTAQGIKNGADLVDYWQNEGLIGSRSDIVDSQEHDDR